jgi:hypothetical protein
LGVTSNGKLADAAQILVDMTLKSWLAALLGLLLMAAFMAAVVFSGTSSH